jgi:hypothetical protein
MTASEAAAGRVHLSIDLKKSGLRNPNARVTARNYQFRESIWLLGYVLEKRRKLYATCATLSISPPASLVPPLLVPTTPDQAAARWSRSHLPQANRSKPWCASLYLQPKLPD